jgi:YHS domain-containing protein
VVGNSLLLRRFDLNEYHDESPKEAAKMVKDPVCGMKVDEKKAAKTEFKGKAYYFCCLSCQETFDKDPEKYLRKR